MTTHSPYSLGLIGCRFGAWVGRDLVKMKDGPVKLSVVCDLNAELVGEVSKELGVRAETDYKKLLADPEIKVIGLYTGPNGRAKFLHEILLAGKDIMTTKPFEFDPAQARWVLDEARRLGRVIHLNSPNPKLESSLATILEWQRKHDLGRPAYFLQSVHASYFEKPDGTWLDEPARCPAAPLFRIGIYLVNDIQAVLGNVESIKILQSKMRTARPTADNAVMALKMKNGAVGSIAASFCVQDGDHYRNSLQLSFERGTVYRDFGPQRGLNDKGEVAKGEMTLIQEKDGRRRIVDSCKAVVGGGYDWDTFAEAVTKHIPADEAYAERIVSGVEVMQMMAEAQKLEPLAS